MTSPHGQSDSLTQAVLGCAIEVHRALGPGLMESAYQQCLAFELKENGFSVETEVPMPVLYKGVKLDCGYRLDLVVDRALVMEIKSVGSLLPIHRAQLLTYMKLAGIPTGLLINFHVPKLVDGVERLKL